MIKGTNASLTQNQCLQCITPPLTHVEIPQPRDATELNNDGMIKLGNVHYQTESNLSIFPFKRAFINDDSCFSLHILLATDLLSCFSFWKAFVKCLSVCKRHFWWRQIWRHLHVTMLQSWA